MGKKRNKIPTLNLKDATDSAPVPKATSKLVLQLIFWAIMVFAIALLMVLGSLAWKRLYLDNPRLLLKQISFKDTAHYATNTRHGCLSMATILSENGIELGKTNLLSLELDKVQQILDKHPLLSHVKVSKVLPDTLKIEATERKPVAILCANGQQFPIAEKDQGKDSPDSHAAVLLPPSLNLYDSRQETTVQWNYVIYPTPFDPQVVNTTVPYLFAFPLTSGNPAVGHVEQSPKLAAALRLLRMSGATSANRFFTVRQITLHQPDTLRVTVMPTPLSRLICNYAQFDFSCSNVTRQTMKNIQNYLQALENKVRNHQPCNRVMYLNATGAPIYSSPTIPKH